MVGSSGSGGGLYIAENATANQSAYIVISGNTADVAPNVYGALGSM